MSEARDQGTAAAQTEISEQRTEEDTECKTQKSALAEVLLAEADGVVVKIHG